MKRLKSKIGRNKIANLIIGFSILIGGGSLVIFMVFLYTGSQSIVDLDMDIMGTMWLDFSLCLLFFIQHSSMIRVSFRRWVERFILPHYYGVFFSISSGIALLLLVILWQDSGRTVLALEGVFRLLPHLTFVLSIIGIVWGVRALRSFDLVGRDQVVAHIRGKKPREMPFAICGPYRYVRHPFYFFMLLMIWSSPDVSLDRLLFNSLWTIWIVIGTVLEERDLVVNFGADYRNYQRNVPMIVPWLFVRKHSRAAGGKKKGIKYIDKDCNIEKT